MSNTPPAWPWLFLETPLNRNRSPMIWKSASPMIRSPNLPTCRFFARYPRWSTGSRPTAWRAANRLPYELAINGLNFNHFYLGGLHSAYVRARRCWRFTSIRKPLRNFRRFSIIAGSSARIRSALRAPAVGQNVRACGRSGKSKLPTRISSRSGRTRTLTSDSQASEAEYARLQ